MVGVGEVGVGWFGGGCDGGLGGGYIELIM